MKKSFTLIELMIVVAIIAIIAAIAIPGLLRARISSNETSAIGSLRTTSTSQNQFQNATTKDQDDDGVGEYGYFTELSGIAPVAGGPPAKPAFISTVFGATSSGGAGTANKSGFNFRMFLPAGSGGPAVPETGSDLGSGSTDTAEINAQETRWATFSWPTSAGNSGNKAFFVNQAGEVIATSNVAATATVTEFYFSGDTTTPTPADIFESDTDLDDDLIVGSAFGAGSLVWNPTN